MAGPRRRLADRARGARRCGARGGSPTSGRAPAFPACRSRLRCPRPGRPDRVDRAQVRVHPRRRSSERDRQRPGGLRALRDAGPPAAAEGGARRYDAVTARAVGRLSTLAELASPLLAEGGALVAWKGRRDADEEAELERASARLAMGPVEISWVGPYAGSRHRHLHVMRKAGPTPERPPAAPGDGQEAPPGRPLTAPVARPWVRSHRMGSVYAIANQKGGVGKTTTAVNVAACVAAAGAPGAALRPRRAVQRDRRRSAWGASLAPSSYDCLIGECSVAEAARPAGPDNLWIVPANRDLAGAAVELPRIKGSEPRLRDMLGPVRERFGITLLDCPPSLGPVTVNALVAADRVIVPVQAEYLALEGLVQFLDTVRLLRRELNPAPGSDRRRDHHARRADEARPGRRAPASRALRRAHVSHCDSPQRPGRRGPQLRPAR